MATLRKSWTLRHFLFSPGCYQPGGRAVAVLYIVIESRTSAQVRKLKWMEERKASLTCGLSLNLNERATPLHGIVMSVCQNVRSDLK